MSADSTYGGDCGQRLSDRRTDVTQNERYFYTINSLIALNRELILFCADKD